METKKNNPYQGRAGVLVIIDMQPEFESSAPTWLQTKVRKEITQARFANWFVFFLEFAGKSATYSLLLEPVQKPRYTNFLIVEKTASDGSEQILTTCRSKQIDTSLFRVCGVNIHECVQDTVVGLSSLLPLSRIEVITNACNCHSGKGWRSFSKANNVILRGLKNSD